MNPDLLDRHRDPLVAARPNTSDLDALWGSARREAALERVLAQVREDADGIPARLRPMSSRRRFLVLVGVAAASAAAVVVVPAVLAPTSLPAAGALDRLATTAGRTPALVIPAGRFLHLVVHDTQTGGGESASGSRTLESWTASEGEVWRRDTDGSGVAFHRFPAQGEGPIDLSPAGVAALPTEAGAFLAYLQGRVQGSTSADEAVFVAVGDMTRLGYVPPRVRAAAIGAIGRLPQVTAVEDGGTVTATFVDEEARPGVRSTLVFDSATSALVAESLIGADLTYRSETTTSELVRSVPRVVTDGAAASTRSEAKQATGQVS